MTLRLQQETLSPLPLTMNRGWGGGVIKVTLRQRDREGVGQNEEEVGVSNHKGS